MLELGQLIKFDTNNKVFFLVVVKEEAHQRFVYRVNTVVLKICKTVLSQYKYCFTAEGTSVFCLHRSCYTVEELSWVNIEGTSVFIDYTILLKNWTGSTQTE